MRVNWAADYCKSLTKLELKVQITRHNKFKKSYYEQKIKRQKYAAKQCQRIWDSAVLANDLSHKYLINKKVRADGVRQIRNQLLVPIRDLFGNLVNIQYINSAGIKKFHLGAAVSGNFMVIGELVETVYIVEGYATGATIHELSGNNVVVAFNVGNLEAVVKSLREINGYLQLIIAADNDHLSLQNVGLSVAAALSQKFKIGLVYPKFEVGQIGSDFNDLARYYPPEVLLAQLREVINGSEI